MDVIKLREEFNHLIHPKTTSDCSDRLDIYAKYFFNVVTSKAEEKSSTLMDADAKIVNQMIFLKTISIKKIIEGVGYQGQYGLKINPVIDPTILISSIRNVFETVMMFHLVYMKTKNLDERTIIYSLWVIAGLNYRQRFVSNVVTEYGQEKLNDEQKTIAEFIKTIRETELYKGLTDKNKGRIEHAIENWDYRMLFENKEVKVFNSWQQLAEVVGCKKVVFENIYTYFSLYAHPSNVSVFAFADMFKKDTEEFKKLTVTNLGFLFILLSIFIADYIKLFPELIEEFNKLNLQEQLFINHHNFFGRGENYSINDSWKQLG